MTSIEAALYLRDREPLKLSTIRDIILHAWADHLNGSVEFDDTVFRNLLDTYNALLSAKCERVEKKLSSGVTADAAEKVWFAAALAGFRVHFPDTPETSESVPMWPDELPFHYEHRPKLLQKIAFLSGYKQAVETAAYFRYAAREDAALAVR